MALGKFSVSIFWLISLTSGLTYSQSQNMTLRTQWHDATLDRGGSIVYNDIWAYVDESNREYAIVGTYSGTIFFDVTDPEKIVEVDRIDGGSNCTWRDYKTFGPYAYGVSDKCNGGLEIFDLSYLPDSVSLVFDSDQFFYEAHNIFIDTASQKLYACGVDVHDIYDLCILDLSNDPSTPLLINKVDLNLNGTDYVHDLYVKNDTAYLCNAQASRTLIYDFNDPSNPSYIGLLSTNGYNHSVWLSEDQKVAIIADETHGQPLRVFDLSDLDGASQTSVIKSALLSPHQTNSVAHNPYIVNNDFAVISYYEDGIQVYDIKDIYNPIRIGYYDTNPNGTSYNGYNGAWGVYPFLPSGNIIASDIYNGLFVITPQFPLKKCDSNVNISGVYDNSWYITSTDSISTNSIHRSNSDLTLLANDEINFKPGFEVSLGSTLSASQSMYCKVYNGALELAGGQ